MGSTHFRSDIREKGAARTASFSTFQGDLTGDVTGDVVGNVTGDVTGSVQGGNLSGTNLVVTNASVNTLARMQRYIGTNASITTASLGTANVVTANVTASLKVGNTASYVMIDQANGVRLVGIDSWEDLRVPVSTVVVNPANSKPDWVAFVGNTRALGFDNTASEWVSFSAQLPHNYLQGSDIEAHLHWSATDGSAGGVRWVLDYTWANIGSPFPAIASLAETSAAASANTHTYCDLEWITGTGKTVSSVLMCRLWRDVAHTDDDYAADAALLEFDFHYQVDGFGSENEDSKA